MKKYLLQYLAPIILGGHLFAGEDTAAKYDVCREAMTSFKRDKSAQTLNQALQAAESIPVDSQHANWPVERERRLVLFLKLLALTESALDPDYQNQKMPLSPPPPPKNAPIEFLTSGGDPETLRDPAMRKEYEKQMAASKEKLKAFQNQARLHMHFRILQDYISGHVRSFFMEDRALAQAKRAIDREISSPKLKENLNASIKKE